ncbi:N-acetylmuramoyl-L-alanine amidase [Palleronia caenipelagi]|uniref:N-acetylmuramoyl-L-alanine amidase n=1 Tax=Palleronia caenipelagi TaxID=2489174 RepID=UPI001FE667E6|nr:N-acetylmuramoyl-L-alanine amidase [Palleronia caenipelagi]
MRQKAEPPCDRPSPNHGERREGAQPDLIVLHYTAMESAEEAISRLCDPEVEVSAHYLIDRIGAVVHMVPEALRAWHAGAGAWGDVRDVNSRSIGIELCNRGCLPFPEAQMRALEELLADIMARWQIPPHRVIGHSDCAPGRKSDPGPRFDWTRLARQGLAAPTPAVVPAADQRDFTVLMHRAGYTGADDPEVLLMALRLRHRPGHDGPLDGTDLALARALAIDAAPASA